MSSSEAGANVVAARYYLKPHVFLARPDGAFVFLDLARDDYLCLDRDASAALAGPLGLGGPPGPPPTTILDELVSAGLLTDDAAAGKPAALVAPVRPLREMPIFPIDRRPRIRIRHVLAFARALATARFLLRFAPIETIVARVARRRAAAGPPPAPGQIPALVERYRALRPLFASRKDRCLLNALLLIEFLARFGVHPGWHFGVHLREFRAHCWVQDGPLLYDDAIETVAKYDVIMQA